jgi:uncharacterized protein YjdB
MRKFSFLFLVLILFSLFGLNTYSYAQESKLYFCEQYRNGKEIGVSDTFTPGWLTVMVDLRPDGKKFQTTNVEIQISKIKDANGNNIREKIIKTIPFSVQYNWDYAYFEDRDKLKFDFPGTYRVVCQKVNGTPIVEGELKIIPE